MSEHGPAPQQPGTAGSGMTTFALRERAFLIALVGCFLLAALSYDTPWLAMWVGFMFAGYSAVANDSIQTIGTFIASNKAQKWWVLWLFIGGIFIATSGYSWWNYGSGWRAEYFPSAEQADAGAAPIAAETYPGTHLDWVRHAPPAGVDEAIHVRLSGRIEPKSDTTAQLVFQNCTGSSEVTFTAADGTETRLRTDSPTDAPVMLTLVEGQAQNVLWRFDQVGDEPTCDLDWLVPGKDEAVRLPTSLLFTESYGGDVSWGRLGSKGFDRQPTSFAFLQVAAPIFLLILTRLRMPVSTTFLILTSFATSTDSIWGVVTKSLTGYALAFVLAIALWMTLGRWMKSKFVGTPAAFWRPFQWVTTGFLWSVWLMQDAANIAVYLPRQLNPAQFIGFAGFVFAGLGLLFYMRGERIQAVVDEKSAIEDVRPATIIDLLYGFILYYFKVVNSVPMSTTWVFIGLLGGRELAMSITRSNDGRSIGQAVKLMARDIMFVTFGFIVSLVLAVAINPNVRDSLLGGLLP